MSPPPPAAAVIRCAHCGADVPVASAVAIVVSCGHCRTLLLRRGLDSADIGRVAAPVPLGSSFRRGTTGTYAGRPFVVRGQLQLDHGAGPWNEWAAECDDGGWLWIAEAQGEFLVFAEQALDEARTEELRALAARYPRDPNGPVGDELRAGRDVRLGGARFRVIEVGVGRVTTLEGELPVEPAIGTTTRYVDLGRGAAVVATLDLTRDEPELLVGERVRLADLALDPETVQDAPSQRVAAERMRCPECDGELVVHDPHHAVRVACVHCGAVLADERDADTSGANEGGPPRGDAPLRLVTLLAAEAKAAARSPLPLGARGRLAGEVVQVLGALGRRVRAGGVWYPWREVLLRREDGGYLWLVEANGHWLLARPVPPAAVEVDTKSASYAGLACKHFTGGTAEVHAVVGEFHWRVAVGDTSEVADYVAPQLGRGISYETSRREVAASVLSHLDGADVARAFGLDSLPVRPRGVGMLQPNHARPRFAWGAFAAALAALVLARLAFGAAHAQEVVYEATLGPTPATAEAESVTLTDPLELRRGPANVAVDLAADDLVNGWVGLTGALVDEATGAVTTFATEAQRYAGVTDGEAWSEGNGRGRTVVGSVPEGVYRLRLAGQGFDQGLSRAYTVRVTSQVPRTSWMFLCALPPLLFALIASVRWLVFESARWKDSDHPWGESS